jgi:glycosyltransferase involved in cell wall biosynthesis
MLLQGGFGLTEQMRIAYIAPYQGPALVERRPVIWNLSLAARVKVEVIAELLQTRGHNVEILSQGEIIKHKLNFYPGFTDPKPFDAKIPVYYSSAFPVKYLNGLSSGLSLLRAFKARHRIAPYDVVLIYNLKVQQLMCAKYAIQRLGLPVILEYEDDVFVDVAGRHESGFRSRQYLSSVRTIFRLIAGATAVSPHLLAQLPCSIPKVLLRGVVSDEIANVAKPAPADRKNWVAFSGTLSGSKGLEQLITAWDMLELPDWELHIAGDGDLGDQLRQMAANSCGIVFHGVLNRNENARLLCSAKIGINPHDLSATPGNVFAFKIIEYLAAGAHVVTTSMGNVEPELEDGITYMNDNSPATIAATLQRVIRERDFERTAAEAAVHSYGPQAISRSLDELLNKVTAANNRDQKFVRSNRSVGGSDIGSYMLG